MATNLGQGKLVPKGQQMGRLIGIGKFVPKGTAPIPQYQRPVGGVKTAQTPQQKALNTIRGFV